MTRNHNIQQHCSNKSKTTQKCYYGTYNKNMFPLIFLEKNTTGGKATNGLKNNLIIFYTIEPI